MAGQSKAATTMLVRSRKAFTCNQSKAISSKAPLQQSTVAPQQSGSAASLPLSSQDAIPQPPTTSKPSTMSKSSPLSILPLSSIIRSLAITSISSSKILLPPSLIIMSLLAHTKSPILSPDSNPILHYFLKHTFYKQFCAGENAAEVKQTIKGLKNIGYKGVVLGYAREVVLDDSQKEALASSGEGEAAEKCIRDEIVPWTNGTLETVRIAEPGDFVALKFTGAGQQALYDLAQNTGPSEALRASIDSICELATTRGIRLLVDAEQTSLQTGIDRWTLEFMRKYNKKGTGNAVIYNTYQAYLKAIPEILASHLAIARKEGFTLGVKLVRGAYLGSDPRHVIHDTKEETDTHYDGIAESLIRRSYNPILKPAEGETEFPSINMVLAGHNLNSVRKAQAIRTEQVQKGEQQSDLVYGQLQGMADEVSCELVQAGLAGAGNAKVDVPLAYKYLVWGTTGECMKYLLRRAHENKDAVQRTRDGRNAMAGELLRRVKQSFGLGA